MTYVYVTLPFSKYENPSLIAINLTVYSLLNNTLCALIRELIRDDQ